MFSIYRNQSALSSVTEAWEEAGADFREAILRASRALDELLQHEPHAQGESREGTVRIVFEAPLAVTFEVDETKRIVRILRAWIPRQATDRQDRAE